VGSKTMFHVLEVVDVQQEYKSFSTLTAASLKTKGSLYVKLTLLSSFLGQNFTALVRLEFSCDISFPLIIAVVVAALCSSFTSRFLLKPNVKNHAAAFIRAFTEKINRSKTFIQIYSFTHSF